MALSPRPRLGALTALSALSQYRSLPHLASGSWMGLAVSARAPYAMIPLGALTAFTASTGSVATGGLATGLISVAAAIAGPLIGRAADRGGQRLVLGLLTPLNAAMLALLLTGALRGWDGPGLWAVCLATGATAIPVGSFTRMRWVQLARSPRELGTALSYESTVDELSFVLGPALVGVAASTVLPAAPLALAAALVAGAGIPFALWRGTDHSAPRTRTMTGEIPAIGAVPPDPPLSDHPSDHLAEHTEHTAPIEGTRHTEHAEYAEYAEYAEHSKGTDRAGTAPDAAAAPAAMPAISAVLLAVLPSIIVMVSIGAYFGSVQAATTERATLLGEPGSAGLIYALMGLGSALTALLVVLLPERVTLAQRILVGGLGMGMVLVIAALAGSLPATALVLLAAGLFIGPTMVTAFALTDRRTPPGGTGVAMTSMQSSVTVGQAAGATLGGALAAALGPGGAFGVGITAGVVIAIVGSGAVLRRRTAA